MSVKAGRYLILLLALLAIPGCGAEEPELDATETIEQAKLSFAGMAADADYPGLKPLAAQAKAILIVPRLVRAAFFFEGRGGNAVMLVKGRDGTWSDPAFYTLGGISWGLQFGGVKSELVITVMTDKALRAILDQAVTVNQVGLTVGSLGKGVGLTAGMALTSDLYAFARSGDVYTGVSMDGAVLAPRETWNQELYGEGANPQAILIDRSVNPKLETVDALVGVMP